MCLGVADPVSEVVAAEPDPAVHVASADLDLVCRAFGEVVDLKTPLHHGHAAGVAVLAAAAGQRFGLADVEVAQLRRAALVHDLGRATVPNGVWERRGALSWTDQERIHRQASAPALPFAARVLAAADVFQALTQDAPTDQRAPRTRPRTCSPPAPWA